MNHFQRHAALSPGQRQVGGRWDSRFRRLMIGRAEHGADDLFQDNSQAFPPFLCINSRPIMAQLHDVSFHYNCYSIERIIKSRGDCMISYAPFWRTIREKHISTYTLREKYHISPNTLTRMGQNQYLRMRTIDVFSKMLDCSIQEIVGYIKDEG